jgi:glutamine amidotransferase
VIVIVDYGMGNLRSVQKGLERVGHNAVISSDPAAVAAAERVVLPGVGASADALRAVRERGLEAPLREAVAQRKPFLGICLGLQMLFDVSHEDGEHIGLGLLAGEVVRFDIDASLKVPHMGWNRVRPAAACPLFEGIDRDAYFYFVHAYHVVPADESIVAATTDYGGEFCSAVWRDRLFATQFHPEKSQSVGLRLLKNFAELAR